MFQRSLKLFNNNSNRLLLRSNNFKSINGQNSGVLVQKGLNQKRLFSTQQQANQVEAEDEIAPDEVIKAEEKIQENERVIGLSEKLNFQTETQKILHIVAESLYTEKEVFIRELISNSSDAMEKVRHAQLTKPELIEEGSIPFEIKISTDDDKKTLIIQDSGIGMTKEEMIKNLGNIGYSGSSEFLKKLGESQDKSSIIGQFGVGFYSCFMFTPNLLPLVQRVIFGESDGSGSYTISEADNVSRGTKIIIHLKPNSYEYSKKSTVENIIKKYSSFVGFPILLNGTAVNTIRPLWTLNKNAITEEDHKQFFQYLSKSYDTPSYHIHFSTDTPLSIRSIFYVPSQHMEKYGMGKMEPGVSLFSRKVLIQQKAKGILPDWLRFIRGVVDSEDIPLNVSREHLQDNGLIQRISSVLVKRILKNLSEEAKKDPAKYNNFIKEFGGFFKEGIITDFKWKDDISKLLRFETSDKADEICSLEEYVSRMKPNQDHIFFVSVPNRTVGQLSPYYEPFKLKGIEVLFLYNQVDEFVLSQLGYFGDKKIVSVESKEAEEFLLSNQEKKDQTLSQADIDKFLSWVQEVAGEKVSTAKATTREISSPAIVIDHESATFRRMYKMLEPGKAMETTKQQVEFNMNNPIILKLHQQKDSNPLVAKLVIDQIVDNAFASAGLIEDNREMIPRINQLLETVLNK
ncbi:TNF receptor-associated protein [Dictyostelium purpureum]|uniref:TNF receptor-associated protein n=1 Tax=Dictyostelium purpureum TaxID=5786 RepID=F0ZWG1_DICPU|nr:TNF receptor-associated protein [Dictyostelium purpureum]EGC31718.1 TNF receptor-associated protein [Dictyostelium purpureum]|eukprot:XP_003291752.1 TNF receptor-associated protein [Dictyostelium purpureum]